VNGEQVKDARELAAPSAAFRRHHGQAQRAAQGPGTRPFSLTLGQLPNTVEAKADNDNDDRGGVTRGTDVPKLGMTVAPANSVAGAGKEGVVVTRSIPRARRPSAASRKATSFSRSPARASLPRATCAMRSRLRAATTRTAC